MNEVTKKEISAGKDPMGIAATVIYVSCLKTVETEPKLRSGTTEVTVRNRYKELKSKPGLN
jgi:transcription initiation factor TFIIB